MDVPPEDMEKCLEVLQRIADSPGSVYRDARFRGLISKIHKAGMRDDKRAERWRQTVEDRALLATTGMVQIQRDALPPPCAAAARYIRRTDAEQPGSLLHLQSRLIPKSTFSIICCARTARTSTIEMRDLRADLTGRMALVTGGRVKIGYPDRFAPAARRGQSDRDDAVSPCRRAPVSTPKPIAGNGKTACICMASICATSRLWKRSRGICWIPNRSSTSLFTTPRRPFAARTGFIRSCWRRSSVRRRLCRWKRGGWCGRDLPSTPALTDGSALLPAAPSLRRTRSPLDILPADALEDNEERADSRTTNSWLLRLDDVSAPEMLEVQLVNSVAPFLLNSRLKPLLLRSPFARRFIVNVSAMEGQFQRHKTVFHPHTNMAKAALNMMTRTSGEDYARDGIYMNSVDTGWVTDENPTPKRTRRQEESGFFPPLDIYRRHGAHLSPDCAGHRKRRRAFLRRISERLRALSLVTFLNLIDFGSVGMVTL